MTETKTEAIRDELFERCLAIARSPVINRALLRKMHEILAETCAIGTEHTGMAFGNIFAQVGFVCRHYGIDPGERHAIEATRRMLHDATLPDRTAMLSGVRSLAVLIGAVWGCGVPPRLAAVLPQQPAARGEARRRRTACIRCIVEEVGAGSATLTADADGIPPALTLPLDAADTPESVRMLRRTLAPGMQLNLIGCTVDGATASPEYVVLEPDFLVDISSVAACFTHYGRSPLTYLINRLRRRANSQPILLGNLAGKALDSIIRDADTPLDDIIDRAYRDMALQISACPDFSHSLFEAEADAQARHIRQAVGKLRAAYRLADAVVEPSFVCEQLGLQGRVDLMTTDLRLLVEQKSGRNFCIERGAPGSNGSMHLEPHYVQLLLYNALLCRNFDIKADHAGIFLLYSKYPAADGLLAVNDYHRLFLQAVTLRNRIVAMQLTMAEKGVGSIRKWLTPDVVNEAKAADRFYTDYLRPQIEEVTEPLRTMEPVVADYFDAMATFVVREELTSKIGSRENRSACTADLWNMPLGEKRERGDILTGLRVAERRRSAEVEGYDIIAFALPAAADTFLPNFRQGDMVYVYSYTGVPDVRRALLFKGYVEALLSGKVTLRLADAQSNDSLFRPGDDTLYAIEHSAADSATAAQLSGLFQFVTAPADRRNLLLGRLAPRFDTKLTLTRPYSAAYDDMLLMQKQARDYFLLCGPPGTGKTSMAMRFIVEEELAEESATVLLMSYTNRAVDEICGMLESAGADYLRIGNESACSPHYRHRLLSEAMARCASHEEAARLVGQARIIVATTSTMMARPFVFDIKRFTLAVVDEASQIVEPALVGLLAAHRGGECCIGRFVLIGDYKQLPAVVQTDPALTAVDSPLLRAAAIEDCRQSLFERLLRLERTAGRRRFTGVLRRQGRMHPGVADFPTAMFYRSEELRPVPCSHQLETSLGYDAPAADLLDERLKTKRLIFLPSEPCRSPDTSDKVNVAEARIVADLLVRLRRLVGRSFDPARTVGVIVPYRNQISMIRAEIERTGIAELLDVAIDTVERYQGSQRDVIIYSFTVQTQSQLRFIASNCFEEDGMTIDRKLNVAMTRARRQMIMTGNVDTLKHNALFAELMAHCR